MKKLFLQFLSPMLYEDIDFQQKDYLQVLSAEPILRKIRGLYHGLPGNPRYLCENQYDMVGLYSYNFV